MTSKNLVQKLCEVTKAVGKVKKTGHNSFQHYDYVREDDLTDVLREELANRNIFVSYSVVDVKKDGDIFTIKTKHKFHDGDSGETMEVEGAGAGHDKLEKGLFKAQTSAQKYFLLKCFLIGTNDDPEQDNPAEKPTQTPSKPVSSANGKAPETKKPTFPGFKTKDQPKVEY